MGKHLGTLLFDVEKVLFFSRSPPSSSPCAIFFPIAKKKIVQGEPNIFCQDVLQGDDGLRLFFFMFLPQTEFFIRRESLVAWLNQQTFLCTK